MRDKKLADRVVALGVGQHRKFGGVPIRYRFIGSDENMYASVFVRDWRVAGALMEKCSSVHLYWDDVDFGCDATDMPPETGKGHVDGYARFGAARAIIEACCTALETDHE